MERRPPPFGTLRLVVPVVQTQRRGEWEMTLGSVEVWDNCWAANVDLSRDPPVSWDDRQSPRVDLEVVDDRGGQYRVGFGGGFGGGQRDGGEHCRFRFTFAPALDPAAVGVSVTARLQLDRYEGGFPARRVIVWEDPEPWVFPVSLTGPPGVPGDLAWTGPESGGNAPPADAMIELMRLRRVVPVVAERADAGWTVTIVAAEVFDGGVRLEFRVRGPASVVGDPQVGLRVADDQGNGYWVWDDAGTGIPDTGAFHWRLSYIVGPELAPDACELRVAIDEIRIRTVEPDATRPGVAKLVVGERFPFGWDCVVDLR